MAKTAVSQLQEQIEAIRREAFAAGFEAAMQSVRQFASTHAPDKGPQSAEPARRRSVQRTRTPGHMQQTGNTSGASRRGTTNAPQAATRHECPTCRRGTPIECAAGVAPGRDPQHESSVRKAWRSHSPRSATLSVSSSRAASPNRSQIAILGGTAGTAAEVSAKVVRRQQHLPSKARGLAGPPGF